VSDFFGSQIVSFELFKRGTIVFRAGALDLGTPLATFFALTSAMKSTATFVVLLSDVLASLAQRPQPTDDRDASNSLGLFCEESLFSPRIERGANQAATIRVVDVIVFQSTTSVTRLTGH
jgi:hypothetical protein